MHFPSSVRFGRIATGFAAISLALALAGPLAAQDTDAAAMTLDEIEAAYENGDLQAVRGALLAHAEAGVGVAQYRLGYMMAQGLGGPYDLAGAKRWLETALAQEYNAGHVLLARVYLSDNPEVPDYERAAELLAQRVEEGDAEAAQYLGQLYRIGRGVPGDPARGFALLRQAAGAGEPNAQFAIAQMYSRGEGTEKDAAQASRWLLSAAEAGQTEAQMSLYFNYSRGTGFAKDEAKALAWLNAAAEGGHALAQRTLGSFYLTGEGGVEIDLDKAIALLRSAAEKGEAGAQSNMGYAYATGTGVAQDAALAVQWYKLAADQGLTRAALAVGEFYQTGRGVDTDLAQAAHYYQIAYRGRDLVAAARLGDMLLAGQFPQGEGLEDSLLWVSATAEAGGERAGAARDWLLERAQRGEAYSWLRLGMIYRDGTGVEADAEKAARYLLNAAIADSVPAQEMIAEIFAAGSGVDQDYVEAHKWANIAAANGSDAGAERRDLMAALMTPDQVAEAQDRARAHLESK